jgi:IS1 family transposase
MHLSSATVHQIIHHTAEGVGVRSTARLLGMNKDTVNRVILRVGQYVNGVLSELMTSLELTEIQLDELWTFVKKKENTKTEEDIECQSGRTWVWTAIDVSSRLLITSFVGGRELDDARSMLKDLTGRLSKKPLFVSDELIHYKSILAEIFYSLSPYAPTGKRGRPRNPEKIIDVDLDYATVHKTREDGKVVKVERKIIFGSEQSITKRLADSPSNTINTSYVERTNGTLRLHDSHLRRKSVTFAKSIDWLKAKLAICIGYYNLVKPHGTLSETKRLELGHNAPTTPAMAANIADHPWNFYELFGLQLYVN